MQKKIDSFYLFLGWAFLQMCILNSYHNQYENECAKLYKKTKCKKIQNFKNTKTCHTCEKFTTRDEKFTNNMFRSFQIFLLAFWKFSKISLQEIVKKKLDSFEKIYLNFFRIKKKDIH